MALLTIDERNLVQKSIESASSRAQFMKLSPIAFYVTLFGAGLIVLSTSWQFAQRGLDWDGFLNALGFSIVVSSLVWFLRTSARDACVARSAMLKLYRVTHCANCGKPFSVVDDCHSCKSLDEDDGKDEEREEKGREEKGSGVG